MRDRWSHRTSAKTANADNLMLQQSLKPGWSLCIYVVTQLWIKSASFCLRISLGEEGHGLVGAVVSWHGQKRSPREQEIWTLRFLINQLEKSACIFSYDTQDLLKKSFWRLKQVCHFLNGKPRGQDAKSARSYCFLVISDVKFWNASCWATEWNVRERYLQSSLRVKMKVGSEGRWEW